MKEIGIVAHVGVGPIVREHIPKDVIIVEKRSDAFAAEPIPITNPYEGLPDINQYSPIKNGKQRFRPTNFTKPKKRRK